MDPQAVHQAGNTANMPYTHCNTRIVDLLDFDIPDQASEDEYKQLYDRISSSQTPSARLLVDAISSVSLGIAPPVAFPTETVYGLGADATNRSSIAGIFAAKGRPSDNPLIVHVASQEHLERLTGAPVPAVYADLVREHWPGPLTILVPVSCDSVFAPNVHPGQKTIGFRVPESKYARFFIAATGKPIAAPSANSSGRPSPTTAQHVMDDLRGKVSFVLDGGACSVGVESTVVDGLHDPPLVLRPGGLSQDDLVAHGKKFGNAWAGVGVGYKHKVSLQVNGIVRPVGERIEDDDDNEAPRAPGMKYKHYAPRGQMTLFESSSFESGLLLQRELDLLASFPPTDSDSKFLNVAILTTSSNWPTQFPTLFSSPFATTISSSSTTTTATAPAVIHHHHQHHYNNDDHHNRNDHQNINGISTPLAIRVHHIHLGTTPAQIAFSLFAALRECDKRDCQVIFAEAPSVLPLEQRPPRSESEPKTNIGGMEMEKQQQQQQATIKQSEQSAKQSAKQQNIKDKVEDEQDEQEERFGNGFEFGYGFDAVLERMRKAATRVVFSSSSS